MARRAIARRSAPRRTSNNALIKARARAASISRSRSAERNTRAQETSGLMGAGAWGLVERMGIDVPSIPGVPDTVTYGAVTYLVGDRFINGKTGDRVRAAGIGILGCALRDLVAGRAKLGAVEDLDIDSFDDTDLAS